MKRIALVIALMCFTVPALAQPSLNTQEYCGKITLTVNNPTDISVPFEYAVDAGQTKVIEVKPGEGGSVEWQFTNHHIIRYRIFVQDRPDLSTAWQEVETLYEGCEIAENVYPNITIGQ